MNTSIHKHLCTGHASMQLLLSLFLLKFIKNLLKCFRLTRAVGSFFWEYFLCLVFIKLFFPSLMKLHCSFSLQRVTVAHCIVLSLIACNCSSLGSLRNTCDVHGQCPCSASTTGLKCNKCRERFFMSENGCQGRLPKLLWMCADVSNIRMTTKETSSFTDT